MNGFRLQPWLLALALAGLAPLPAAQRSLCAAEQPGPLGVGERVQVLWKGRWYKAVIIGVKPGLYKIHYDGYAASWDEWVAPARVRALAVAPPVTAGWNPGDRVEVLWKRSWYKATIIAVRPGAFQIHYDGYAASWDEWVGAGRIRARH